MRLLRSIEKRFVIVLTLLLLSLDIIAQKSECKSTSVDDSVRCASIIVESANVTAGRLRGKIDSLLNAPILIEIYRIKKSDRKTPSYRLVDNMTPITVIETNDKGEFCHSGLADGYYVIRFGTSGGNWNCTWLKVHIIRGGPDRKIKADLSIGI